MDILGQQKRAKERLEMTHEQRQTLALEQIADNVELMRNDTMQTQMQLQRIAKALENGSKPF